MLYMTNLSAQHFSCGLFLVYNQVLTGICVVALTLIISVKCRLAYFYFVIVLIIYVWVEVGRLD